MREPRGEILRRANDEIQRKRRVQCVVDAARLIDLVPRWHDHHDIHIAVGMRPPVRVRPEQDDLLRIEPLRDLTREAPNECQRHIFSTMPAWPGGR